MATSSARPDDLDDYVTATGDQQPRLVKAAGGLKAALDTFRSSAGRSDFVDDVPEADLDLRFLGNRWDGLADWLAEVSQAFRGVGGNGIATVDDSALNAVVGLYDPPEAEVILDGDRVIIDSGSGDDDIEVIPLGGDRVMIVVNGEEQILEGDAARNITVRGNAGNDTIDGVGLFLGLLPLAAPGALTLDGGAGNDRIRGGRGNQLVRGDRGDDEIDGGHGDDILLGGAGDDILRGGSGNDLLDGGAGGDTVHGDTGDDTILGRAGDDTIDGGDGDDTIDAGDDNNTVSGGAGDDTITTGSGSDEVDGGAGNDTLDTGDGDDTVTGGDGNDIVDAGDGRDYVDGGSGIDVIDAGDGDDVVYGGDDNDFIEGGDGRDYVDGGAGDDRLSGGAEGDILSGGEGDDTVFGGDGNDTVYAGPGEDFVLGGEGADHMYVEDGDTAYAGDPGDQVTEVTIDMDLIDSIHIDGPPEFVQRVRADLVTLASSPTGSQMLEALRLTTVFGEDLRIVPTDGGNSYSGTINYNVERTSSIGPRPPIVGMFHEMVHALNDRTDSYADGVYVGTDQEQVPEEGRFDTDGDGVIDRTVVLDTDGDGDVTSDELDRDDDGDIDDDDLDLNDDGEVNGGDGWTPNLERQAVGLGIDHDQNPDTPDVPASTVEDHPDELTENELRRELQWPERPRY
ncbi:MAG: M91 family zinc metallopeptidase [Acidimicrobiales bacterium]